MSRPPEPAGPPAGLSAGLSAGAPPEPDWSPLPLPGFAAAGGPYWTRGHGAARALAMLAEPRHANSHRGTVHGGALMTLADVCLGVAAADALDGPRCVTAQLQMQFVAAGRVGQWLVARAELVRRTRHLLFLRGTITADGAVVATADGLWKALALDR